MDQQPSKPEQTSLNKNLLLTFIIVIILIIIGAGAAIYFISREGANQNVNQNQNVSQASFQNINGKVACGDNNECPLDYSCVSVYAVSGTEEKLCVRNDALNVNGAVNENTNLNTNQAVNQNVNQVLNENTNTAQPTSDWQTVTYQEGEHGFTLNLPSSWYSYAESMGFLEGRNLISASTYEEGSEGGSLLLAITFYQNSEPTFSDWVAKKRTLLEAEYGTLTSTPETISQTPAYLYEDQNDNPRHKFVYLERDSQVYQLEFSGEKAFFQKNAAVMDLILASFTFIEVKELLPVREPSSSVAIGADQAYDLTVSWLAEIADLNFNDPLLIDPNNYISRRDYYKVGEVQNGRYQGMDLINILETPEGPSFSPSLYRVIYDSLNNSFTYLEKYSANLSYFESHFTYDVGATIKDLELPAEIAIPNSEISLREELYNDVKLFTSLENLTKLFDDNLAGTVYFEPNQNCFIVETPDQLIKQYHLKLNFIENLSEGEYLFDHSSFVPDILWLDTTGVSEEYTYNEIGGCGSRDCHAIFTSEELGGELTLVVTGQTATGDQVYEFQDENHEMLKEIYDLYYAPSPEDKESYQEFVASHPIFFWKDPFGHWVRFQKTSYLPAAECGKPVIYLYPEAETKVRVQVNPNGGFSLTEPEYPEGGWQVTAYPDGQLVTSNGNQYPYLFWEGKGINYLIPNKGFVVAKEEVKSFLSEKLIQLGLNEKESTEFMDFWVPKMQEKPYYFLTFVDQTVFDRLAPLKIDPQPDTIIRIFMDYQGLTEPISVEPLRISTPQRKGFTVVEWGGALH